MTNRNNPSSSTKSESDSEEEGEESEPMDITIRQVVFTPGNQVLEQKIQSMLSQKAASNADRFFLVDDELTREKTGN